MRSFGELIGHLANERYLLLCSPLKGEADPMAKVDFENSTPKTDDDVSAEPTGSVVPLLLGLRRRLLEIDLGHRIGFALQRAAQHVVLVGQVADQLAEGADLGGRLEGVVLRGIFSADAVTYRLTLFQLLRTVAV